MVINTGSGEIWPDTEYALLAEGKISVYFPSFLIVSADCRKQRGGHSRFEASSGQTEFP